MSDNSKKAEESKVNLSKEITLILKDGERKSIPLKYAMNCMFLKSVIDEYEQEEQYQDPIEVTEISEEHWSYLINFFNIYDKNPLTEFPPQPLQSRVLSDYLPQEYVDFIDTKSLEDVYEIMCDGNFLDFKALTHLCAIKIAKEMKGKTIEEIRNLFSIEDDFSEAEKKEIQEEEKEATGFVGS